MIEPSTVRLRALSGSPLADERVRALVVATANAIAERNGVELIALAAEPSSITVTLRIDRLAALGFLAELRRLTNAWYSAKHRAGPLWGELPPSEDDWTLPPDA